MASNDQRLPGYSSTPPIPVPPPSFSYEGAKVAWSTGLCACFSDLKNCCITFWCPCIVDRGTSSCGLSGALYALISCVTGCPCFYSCFYRTKMRKLYSLQESPCGDCLVHFCCETCALCQEYRELRNQGFDMSLGWDGNMEVRNRELNIPPINYNASTAKIDEL